MPSNNSTLQLLFGSLSGITLHNPDIVGEIVRRSKELDEIEADPGYARALRLHYRDNPWDFVGDWGVTFDPRNLEVGRLTVVPFVLWPKQVEYLKWVYARWLAQERGLVEKSRDCGVTWLSVGFAVSMWTFRNGFTCRFGSRKEDLVDKRGDMDSIFEKIAFFIDNLPRVFKPAEFDRAHMRMINPQTESAITGEAGDDIGRGGRASIAFVDEAAFIEHQALVDQALSLTTNCQIDISTPNGSGNLFYRKRQKLGGTDKLFVFDWRDDPRKDDAWYVKQKEEQDEVTVAQEIDRDYNASSEDSFIPAQWVAASIDAHKKLGFRPQGVRVTGFDPADVGDAKACCNRYGSVILGAEQKRDGDITHAIPWAFDLAEQFRADVLAYDGDGMGAPVIKVALQSLTLKRIKVVAYHGSGGVVDAGRRQPQHHQDDKPNIDRYLNYRAQTWEWVRERFRLTFEAIQRADAGMLVNADPDTLISIDSGCTKLVELQAELSRPKRIFSPNGKIKMEAKADMKKREVESPNLADALVIAMSIAKIPDDSPHAGRRRHVPSSWESI